MKRLAIFDLDGTLLNTIADLASSVNYVLEHYNLPQHGVEKYNFMVGNGVDNMLRQALPNEKRYDDALFRSVRQEFITHYTANASQLTTPYEGMTALLEKLQAKGLLLAVASNKIHSATVELVGRFFPAINFVAVFGQRAGFPIKPDPLIVEEILSVAQAERTEALYIGDSAVDIRTARNAGVDMAAVTWGFRPLSELKEHNPTFIVDSTEELEKIILEY
jgi:phosphoglycolate phosphatase